MFRREDGEVLEGKSRPFTAQGVPDAEDTRVKQANYIAGVSYVNDPLLAIICGAGSFDLFAEPPW